ncbi:hypothetical protein HDU85_005205 [Gaertneriomyces sp. JEL0708]|nr:hypothetical protein HDU85_005205 [Gaertneriomyces sp. JEL0708]
MLASSPPLTPRVSDSQTYALFKSSLLSSVKTAVSQLPANFTRDAKVHLIPTAHHATGLMEIEAFIRSVAESGADEKVISRVEAEGVIVEEVVWTVVHDRRLSWLLEGVKETGRRIVVPMSIHTRFSEEHKISHQRIYWDQGSVMKQIGLLPTSLFCKPNNSETALPVVGVKVADGLVEGEFIAENQTSQRQDSERPVGARREPAHGILPPGGDDHYSVNSNRTQAPSTVTSVLPEAEFKEPQPRRTLNHKPSAVALAMSDDATPEPIRPSTRVHYQPGGKSSGIFDETPLPLKTSIPIDPKRFESHIQFGMDDEQVAAGKATGSNAGVLPSAAEPDSYTAHHMHRRDPNWSSVTPHDDAPAHGKRTYGGVGTHSHFTLSDEGVNNDHNEIGFKGRKHSLKTWIESDIFKPAEEVRRIGRRDPNQRSEETLGRPSSRVLRPPGGGQSFSIQ